MDIADLYHAAQEKYEEEQRAAWFAAQDGNGGKDDPYEGDFTSWLEEVVEPFMSFTDFCEEYAEMERDIAIDRRYPNI